MATGNLFLSHQTAERRAILASERLQGHGEALDALWSRIDRLEGSRNPSEKGWLTRYRREFERVQKLERRALRDWEREVERANAYAAELKQRQRAAAVDRRKAKVKTKAPPLQPKKLVKGKPPKKGKAQKKKPLAGGGVEYVLKVKYKSPKHTSEARHHGVWWDVRLKKANGRTAKPSELRMVVRHVKTHGAAPAGWEALGIRWDRGPRPTWEQLPSRDAEMNGQDISTVLAGLSHTMVGADYKVEGTTAGEYEIGEEMMDDDEMDDDE